MGHLQSDNNVHWHLMNSVRAFLDEVATGNSKVFTTCMPDSKKRRYYPVSDSTLMFGKSRISLSAVWQGHGKKHERLVVAIDWNIQAGARAADLLSLLKKLVAKYAKDGRAENFQGA